MWVRWAEGVRVGTAGVDATIDMEGLTIVLPGGATLVSRLCDLLREPRAVEVLKRELLSANPAPRVTDALRELINAQALTPWELGPELTCLHQQTIVGGECPIAPAALETSRMFRETGGRQGIRLPYAGETGLSFQEILNSRRTCHAFRPRNLTLEQLGGILSLAASAGETGPPVPKVLGGPPGQRTYPSGGGLYPVEVLVYPAYVSGVAPGFYYYQALAHRLVPWAPEVQESLKTLLAGQPVDGAAFFVLFFLDFTRLSLSKYGKKAYRLALLEAGHIAQNVLLAASAFRLAGLPLCGFDDEGLSLAAGLRYPEQPVVYVLAVGSAARDVDE